MWAGRDGGCQVRNSMHPRQMHASRVHTEMVSCRKNTKTADIFVRTVSMCFAMLILLFLCLCICWGLSKMAIAGPQMQCNFHCQFISLPNLVSKQWYVPKKNRSDKQAHYLYHTHTGAQYTVYFGAVLVVCLVHLDDHVIVLGWIYSVLSFQLAFYLRNFIKRTNKEITCT